MRSAIIGALALFSSVDGPQPLAALERTPRPATLAFGEGGPDAVTLSAALVSSIGCGKSDWCAELRPEHFATPGNTRAACRRTRARCRPWWSASRSRREARRCP